MTEIDELLPLVVAAQAGDREAFNELTRRFEKTVLAIAYRRLRNWAEAAELTQDVFVQVLRKLGQLREPERFPGWIKRITVRLAINRAVRRPPELISDPQNFVTAQAKRQSPVDSLLKVEDAQVLRYGLNRLKDLDRQTLVAFYFEGQSLIEMSDRFASPVGTIKRRLHTARARLKDELASLQPA
jgi:RNA polymerase sigma-70 factor, ECF subfamily